MNSGGACVGLGKIKALFETYWVISFLSRTMTLTFFDSFFKG